MHIGDLKRAVEDVVLRPDDNRLSDMEERSTIAALDLCQLGQAQGTLPRTSTSSQIQRQRTATTLTSSSYSGEMLASSTESTCSTSITTSSSHVQGAPPLSMSTSLDTMVVLRQTLSSRPSLGTSRRSSRVLPHYSHSKRKRSNSVSSCMNKGFLIHHGVASTAGVSATTTGGASALSLPPTARHTPFRFGDFDEHSSTKSASGDNPRTPYTTNLIEPMLEIRIQQQKQQHQPLISEEWTNMCKERRNDRGYQQSGKFEDSMIANRQTANNCAPKLFPVSSFTEFREAHKGYDSDNEEQMECD
ncbi:hypothetical protein LOAG_07328 [Loa loa]|uniref:Uncharacterized protein n=1 Tax=Loa loa TaxID=7209 RepID=A0A1I7W5A6_LOALO|nr:hypothetical protein LOAG_07328 [Loa loa]EFO21159.1 hypothetical protein LOAG_07328 [Loa loa]